MDKDSPNRVGTKEELRRHMDEKRRAMSETVGEIKEELSQALDWKTYVRRYPEAFVVGGVLAGVVIGRAVKGLTLPEHPRSPSPERRFEPDRERRFELEGERRFEPEESAPAHAGAKPAQESTLRRLGEILATAVIAQVAPVLSAALKRALGLGPAPMEEPPTETRKPWLH